MHVTNFLIPLGTRQQQVKFLDRCHRVTYRRSRAGEQLAIGVISMEMSVFTSCDLREGPCYCTAALSSSRGLGDRCRLILLQSSPRNPPPPKTNNSFPKTPFTWTNILCVFPRPNLISVFILCSVQRYVPQKHTETASCC